MPSRVRSVAADCSAPWRSAPGIEDSAADSSEHISDDGGEDGGEDGNTAFAPGVEAASPDVGAAPVRVITSRLPSRAAPDRDLPSDLGPPPIWRIAPGVEDALPRTPSTVQSSLSLAATLEDRSPQTAHDVGGGDAGAAVRPRAARAVPPGLRDGTDTVQAEITDRVELAAPQVSFDRAAPDPGGRAVRSGSRAGPELSLVRSVRSLEPVSDVEASSFAARFACDFQSFDEDAPQRRAEVLRDALADPAASTWGWTGVGRQRADSPVPSRLYRRSDTVVFVEVVVRATPYRRAHATAPGASEDCPGGAGGWVEPAGTVGRSCAPPEADPGWVAVEAVWVRMTVPVTREASDGRLIVDPELLSGQVTETGGRS